MTDDQSPAERVHPRRALRLLETCAVCRSLFDLRRHPGEARGPYCSTGCLDIARRVRGDAPATAA